MSKIVIFNENGARIYKNPDPVLILGAEYIENPDLSAVKGLPPHLWALDEGKVVPAKEKPVKSDVAATEAPIVEAYIELPKSSFDINSLKPLLYIALGAIAHWLLS